MGATGADRRLRWSGCLLGFALGGFFDGILLHQILQWHHLLSAIDPDNARFQVAADGYFHALMYVIAAAGLWMLATSKRGSVRLLLAGMLIGFGLWHGVDAVLSHWTLGIHRIRMDSAHPLAWDLGWFGAFGLVPMMAGWVMWRRSGQDGDGGLRSATTARLMVALLVAAAGYQALRPQGGAFTTALFAPGTDQAHVMRAVASVGGELVWTDRTGELVMIRLAGAASGWRLFREGAILVSGAGLPPGCFDNLRT
ncbi:DUF2243 domain-containing protein [Microvirga sp. HBU67558]|uniref:DUF2243 domain-containing protein n=1 Tax=Microvirga TaxID=186650 RepID=UPI001B375E09|nr:MULTISPECIES: DUF2243 domain-containing protein [unclassified Microvirga]MBQ0823976.1 DUF2243 domain-containing protein [Microvirga sp. HBU67558]